MEIRDGTPQIRPRFGPHPAIGPEPTPVSRSSERVAADTPGATSGFVVDPRDIDPIAWPNGRGRRRPLLDGDGWRLSLAEISASAPFSRLGGRDRLLLVATGRVILTIDGVEHDLRPGDAIRFRGEDRVTGHAPEGASVVNLIAERGVVECDHVVRPATDAAPGTDAISVVLGACIELEGRVLPPGTVLGAPRSGEIVGFAGAMLADLTLARSGTP